MSELVVVLGVCLMLCAAFVAGGAFKARSVSREKFERMLVITEEAVENERWAISEVEALVELLEQQEAGT